MGRSAPNSCNGSRSTVGVLRTGGPPDFRRASVRPQLRRTSLSAASKARKPAYPLGPRFARPRQGLAGGCAPSDPPQRQRRIMSAGRAVWVKIRASEAERAEWHAKARSAGLTLSDLVRRSVGRVHAWTVAHAEVERERTRELARIGNNLNQIARWANTFASTAEAVEVVAHLVAIERALAALAPTGLPDSDAH